MTIPETKDVISGTTPHQGSSCRLTPGQGHKSDRNWVGQERGLPSRTSTLLVSLCCPDLRRFQVEKMDFEQDTLADLQRESCEWNHLVHL